MDKLQVTAISKAFSDRSVLTDTSLYVKENEIVSILGPSGAGKSTLFSIIAGLTTSDSGEVLLDGESVINRPGKISYMLQKDLLLPYKTIEDNVSLPLILKGEGKKAAREKARELLETFGLGDVYKAYPKELSGGMRQRIALLRTYLFSSSLILLDEPFSALDTFTKADIHQWYLTIHKNLKLTTLFITHDMDEAIKLSNRIYILKNGQIKQADSIKIDEEVKQQENFLLSSDFLAYKQELIQQLKESTESQS